MATSPSTSGGLTMNDWSPPDASGYLEQLSKRAPALIAPADKVVYGGLEKRPIVGYQTDWLTDDLEANLIPAGVAFEGEPTYATVLYRNRLNNVVEMFRKVWSVAEYTEIIAKNGGIGGGIVSEISRQIMLKLKEMAREIDRTIMSLQIGVLEGHSAAPASLMSGYFYAITAGNSSLSKTNTITNFTATSSQTVADFLDETTFQNQILTQYANGASADLWFVCTPKMMMASGRLWEGRKKTMETVVRGDHKIDLLVESYVAPVGGEVTLEPDRSIGDCAALIDREQLAIGEADAIRVFRSDPGSFQNMYGRIRTYLTLATGNPQASGGWTTTNTPTGAGL